MHRGKPLPEYAVILAAGRGTRLGHWTKSQPKPMIPVAGRPLLEHILLRLRDATSIRRFLIVVGYLAEQIVQRFGDGSTYGVSIDYVYQPPHRPGTAGALHAAMRHIPAEPVLMSFGDILTDPRNYQRLLRAYDAQTTAILGVNWLPDVSEGGGVWLEGDRVLRVQEKPLHADTHWNLAGVHLFSPQILPVLDTIAPSKRGEYELTDVIQQLLDTQPHSVRAVRFVGYWNDVGTPERLQQAEAYFKV